MMKIAILGATSQIARDLVISYSETADEQLHLFARRPDAVRQWLSSGGLPGRYPVDDFSAFGEKAFDAVINFVGVGNPAQAVAMGKDIFEITLNFDRMVLEYLKSHPACRYLFLSSGAAYGSSFNEPAMRRTEAVVAINDIQPQDWYGVAKLHAECRHRAHSKYSIIDMRVFNYFSHTQDISARFFITDILRAIRDKSVLKTSSDYIMRDYLHPSDFFSLVRVLLASPPVNVSVDCYSREPLDKPRLLAAMQERFGLHYQVEERSVHINATGYKPFYYSLNKRAAEYGYQPELTSLEGVMLESAKVLGSGTILSTLAS